MSHDGVRLSRPDDLPIHCDLGPTLSLSPTISAKMTFHHKFSTSHFLIDFFHVWSPWGQMYISGSWPLTYFPAKHRPWLANLPSAYSLALVLAMITYTLCLQPHQCVFDSTTVTRILTGRQCLSVGKYLKSGPKLTVTCKQDISIANLHTVSWKHFVMTINWLGDAEVGTGQSLCS